MQIGKEEIRLSLFANGIIVCIENPKESTKIVLELNSEFSKFADIRSTHKNQSYFHMLTTNSYKC